MKMGTILLTSMTTFLAGGGHGDLHYYPLQPFMKDGIHLPAPFTHNCVLILMASVCCILLFTIIARSWKPHGGGILQKLFEPIILFIRNEVVLKNVHHGENFVPYFLTLFFFILFCNLFGLVPFMGTATSNVKVTGALACISFLAQPVVGMYQQGFAYWKNLVPHGVPIVLWPMLFLIELAGLVAKPFALMIRLYANMTGGHMVIGAFLGMIFVFQNAVISLPIVGFLMVFNIMELFVAFLQAYIFTFITSLIVGMAAHSSH